MEHGKESHFQKHEVDLKLKNLVAEDIEKLSSPFTKSECDEASSEIIIKYEVEASQVESSPIIFCSTNLEEDALENSLDDRDNLDKAIKWVMNGNMTQREAARHFKVARTTLQERLKKNQNGITNEGVIGEASTRYEGSESDKLQAIEAIVDGKMTQREAARHFQVPRTTLQGGVRKVKEGKSGTKERKNKNAKRKSKVGQLEKLQGTMKHLLQFLSEEEVRRFEGFDKDTSPQSGDRLYQFYRHIKNKILTHSWTQDTP